ncbi:MAG: hypothetical protein ACPG06_01275 [Alphaproteobacteria bacterium]
MKDNQLDYWGLTVLGLLMAANGAFMFFTPELWFETVPGVKRTGPPNTHFIRDVAVTYAGVGALLILAARNVSRRALYAGLGGGWLALHGLVHLYELATCIAPLTSVQVDFGGVYLPALLALWLALRAKQKETAA